MLLQNADGSYRYAPNANFNGGDSFAYLVNDGRTDSNVATVTITVASVNDGPTVPVARSITLAEDESAQFDLLAGTSDMDGDTLQVAIVNGPAHGSLTKNADGSYLYVPAANFNGSDSIRYSVSDGSVTVDAVLNLTITALNDAPVLADLSIAAQEDTVTTFSLLTNAYDVDGDVLSVAIVAGPAHGTLTVNANGTYTYVAAANYYGSDSFSYRVSDGHVDSRLATVSFSIAAVNDVPLANDFSLSTAEDTGLAIDLLAHAGDNDGNALTAIIVSGPTHGALVRNADGTYSYTPHANYHGADQFTYKVSDGVAESNFATVNLTITAVNDAPLANALSATLAEDGSIVLNLMGAVSDADGDALVISAGNPQSGSLVKNVDGSYTYRPAANFNGADSFSYTVSDGQLSASNTVRLTITAVNDVAVAVNDTVETLQDHVVRIDVLGNDSDLDNTTGANAGIGRAGNAGLTARVIASPLHGVISVNADGSLNYTPNAGFYGSDSFTYVANDGAADSNIASVAITVIATNKPPVAQDDNVTLSEDTPIRIAILANDSDPDGDRLSILLGSKPAHGQISLNADNTVTYTPDQDFSGSDSFTYRISDGVVTSGVTTVRVTIAPVADAPALALINSGGTSRELFRTSWETAVNQSPTFTLVHATQLEGWDLVSDPSRNGNGQHVFEIWSSGDKMPDGNGGPGVVYAASGNGQNWLNLNDGNGAGHDTLGIERSVTTTAGASYTLSFDYAGQVGAGTDLTRIGIYVDGVKLASYANTSPETALNWQALSYQFTGTGKAQKIRIVSEPSNTSANGRGAMIDDIALNETVPLNQGLEDTAIRLSSISAALKDVDGSETLTVNIAALPLGAVLSDGVKSFTAVAGSTSANVTSWNMSRLTLTPPPDFNGTLKLSVVATATETANGNSTSTTAELVVKVVAVNDAPLAGADSATVKSGQTVKVDVVANDTDVDGDSLSARVVTGPRSGSVVRNADGSFSYTANSGFTGTDTFTYKVNDGKLDSNLATVTITVVANKAPIAVNDKFTTAEDTALKIDLLANDTDANGDRLTTKLVTGPAHGKLTQNVDGTWTYVANKDWYGTETFTYKANDGRADSSLATVTISVTPVNDAPLVQNASFQLQQDGSVKIDFSTLICDVDCDVLGLTFAMPAHGTLTRNNDGTYTYKPAKNYTGADSFNYTVLDSKLATTAKISLTVAANRGDDCNDRYASIVVKSPSNSDSDDKQAYVVIGSVAAGTPTPGANQLRVDWSGGMQQGSELIRANWVTDFLGATQDQRTLAEKTGLMVKMKG